MPPGPPFCLVLVDEPALRFHAPPFLAVRTANNGSANAGSGAEQQRTPVVMLNDGVMQSRRGDGMLADEFQQLGDVGLVFVAVLFVLLHQHTSL